MVEQLRYFLNSISFLSILPAGARARLSGRELSASAAYFPAVGLGIGAVGMALALGLERLLPLAAANALVVFYLVVITGGLHLDALADTVDGFAGGKDKAERLKIMRRGGIGPLGVAAVTLALLLKFTFLNALAAPDRLIAILAVPALARWPMVWLAGRLPAARGAGLGSVFASGVKMTEVLAAGLFAGFVCGYVAFRLGWPFLALAPALTAAALAAEKINRRFIGGVTGDTLGAMVEISEVLLMAAIGVISHYA